MNKKNFICKTVLICIFSNLISLGFRNDEIIDYEWKLTFEDNFDTFDQTKWITHFDNGGRSIWSNNELQFYKDENVIIDKGLLKLMAKKESYYGKDVESEKQFEYTSGMICSSLGFVQAYGKWEARVKFPFKKGFWPAFWLVAKQNPGLPEIDIFEYYGINKNSISSTHHWGLDYPNYPGGTYEGKTAPFYYVEAKETKGNFDDVWMIWSFECFPNKMTWKLNENVVFEATEGIPTSPLYILANVAVLDRAENNYEVENSNLPYVMEIDYIKVYKMVPKQN